MRIKPTEPQLMLVIILFVVFAFLMQGRAHGYEIRIGTITFSGQCTVTVPMDRPEFEVKLASASYHPFVSPETNSIMRWDLKEERWELFRKEENVK